jgi:hypothetical protein
VAWQYWYGLSDVLRTVADVCSNPIRESRWSRRKSTQGDHHAASEEGSPAKSAAQATITLTHFAAALADTIGSERSRLRPCRAISMTLTTRYLKKQEGRRSGPPRN